jgi:hypothetical protein
MQTAKLRLALAAASAALAVALMPAGAFADPGGDSASGHATVLSGTLSEQQFDFRARSSSVGTDARGQARFTVPATGGVYSGEVTCLLVVGATSATPALASIGVKITNQPPGQPFLSFIIETSDSGKFSGAPDTAAAVFSTTPAPPDGACPVPLAGGDPVTEGEVTIHNTLP